jgi:cytochrome P450
MTDLRHTTDPVDEPVASLPPGPVRLYGPQFEKDPGALYTEIRRQHGPVAPVLLEGDVPAWFVCGYREVHQVTADSQLFARDTRRWNAWSQVPKDWPLAAYVVHNPSVMFAEGAEHRRRAGAISDALDAVDQFELSTQCERIADQLVDEFAGSGEADLMAQYAERIPLRAAVAMCGMPTADMPGMVRDLGLSIDSSGQESLDAYGRVQQAMARLVADKRVAPGADVPSRLLQHPSGLTDDEIVLDLLVVMAAAHQPTTYWIGNTIRLLLTDVRFATTLSGGRASVGQALNEVLWQDTPTQNFIGRFATRDTRLGGQRIRTGDLLVLGLAAANNDPHVRKHAGGAVGNRAQMSFGHGEHGCPYPAPELAEVIARTSIEVLLDRLPDLMLAVPAEALTWRPSIWMRGLTSLPVRFTQ